jgi:hypothetical protein
MILSHVSCKLVSLRLRSVNEILILCLPSVSVMKRLKLSRHCINTELRMYSKHVLAPVHTKQHIFQSVLMSVKYDILF